MGMWIHYHDAAMANTVGYQDNVFHVRTRLYGKLPGWQNTYGTDSAADGDVDMALAC